MMNVFKTLRLRETILEFEFDFSLILFDYLSIFYSSGQWCNLPLHKYYSDLNSDKIFEKVDEEWHFDISDDGG